jgi:glycosyltransferase involved in cell wall biosynthesis
VSTANRPAPPRIFIGLTEIAGFYGNLAAGFRAAGVQASFVDLATHPFEYPPGDQAWIIRLARAAYRRRLAANGGSTGRIVLWRLVYAAARVVLLVWAMARHDAFVFGSRTSFFQLRDLRLLRWLGKQVVFVFTGSDARPPYIDGADMDPALGRTISDCIALARAKKRQIATIERWSTVVVSHPLYLHLFERPTAGFEVLGLAQPPLALFPEVASEPPEPPIRILHSPSNPAVKGSGLIRAAVDRLIAEGLPLELIEIRNMPNRQVHEHLQTCHFVIDQLYSDVPMSAFAAEAARYGKPAVVGSYGWAEMARLIPDGHRAPVEECHPDELEAAVRRLATDPAHRLGLGAAARRFVEDWAGEEVARRYLRLLEGERPPAWMDDPNEVRYLHGAGLSERGAREIIAAVIRDGGIGALQVSDKPALESAFRDFSETSGGQPPA